MNDNLTAELGKFVTGIANKVSYLVEQEPDEGVDYLVGTLLDCIREAQAHLELCAYECERRLHRG